MRGSAPSETGGGGPGTNIGTNWWASSPLFAMPNQKGSTQYPLDGSFQQCVPAGHPSYPAWAVCGCNQTDPTEYDSGTRMCNARTPSKVRCCCFCRVCECCVDSLDLEECCNSGEGLKELILLIVESLSLEPLPRPHSQIATSQKARH